MKQQLAVETLQLWAPLSFQVSAGKSFWGLNIIGWRRRARGRERDGEGKRLREIESKREGGEGEQEGGREAGRRRRLRSVLLAQ